MVLDVKFTEHQLKTKNNFSRYLEYTLSLYTEKQVIVREYSMKDTEALQVEAYLQAMQV